MPRFTSAACATSRTERPAHPRSGKVYIAGKRGDIRVPMREISQTDTPAQFGAEKNPPVYVYDTSGPYTDPDAAIDIRAGLAALRSKWIEERADTELLSGPTSRYGRERLADPALAQLRFDLKRQPRRARAGANVTQMHYARRGMVTPEMEFVALRENGRREWMREYLADGEREQRLRGNAMGARIPDVITPEFVRDEVARGRAIIPA